MDDGSGIKACSGWDGHWMYVWIFDFRFRVYKDASIYFGDAAYLNIGYLEVKAVHQCARLQGSSPNQRLWSRASRQSLLWGTELTPTETLSPDFILYLSRGAQIWPFFFFRMSKLQSEAAQKDLLQFPSYLS